jgi:hypothetical protein
MNSLPSARACLPHLPSARTCRLRPLQHLTRSLLPASRAQDASAARAARLCAPRAPARAGDRRALPGPACCLPRVAAPGPRTPPPRSPPSRSSSPGGLPTWLASRPELRGRRVALRRPQPPPTRPPRLRRLKQQAATEAAAPTQAPEPPPRRTERRRLAPLPRPARAASPPPARGREGARARAGARGGRARGGAGLPPREGAGRRPSALPRVRAPPPGLCCAPAAEVEVDLPFHSTGSCRAAACCADVTAP